MDTIRSLGFISTHTAAELLGCTIQHIRLLIRQGKVRGEKVGRDWFADEETVREYARCCYVRQNVQPLFVREPQVESLFAEQELQPIVNVASVPQRSPFRYPGGKTWLIPMARLWFRSLTNVDLMVEPFAGGGGIGLAAAFEGFVPKTLLVELDPEVAVVWRVMVGGGGPDLARLIREFDLTKDSVEKVIAKEPRDDLGRAFLTIIRNRASRGGILAPGAGLVKNGEAGKGIASRWYPETLAKRIEGIHDRRESLVFREGDGLEVLCEHQKNPKAAFFIDPPYPVAGKRLYRFHDLDHRSLFQTMSVLKGPFLATYDQNPQIERLAKEFGFKTRLVPMKSTHHTKKYELLIGRSFDWLPELAMD
jgi:DNA adenine methylase